MANYNSNKASYAESLIEGLKELDERTPLVRMAAGAAAGYLLYNPFSK